MNHQIWLYSNSTPDAILIYFSPQFCAFLQKNKSLLYEGYLAWNDCVNFGVDSATCELLNKKLGQY